MKKIVTLLFLACAGQAFSQMTLPDLSPKGKIIQTIGYTNFVIRYERPAARGRKIFGELVPFDKLWRTGAGKGTMIQFDQAVMMNGKEIRPGIYALVSIPGKDQWTILLNSDTSKIYGAPEEYDPKTEVVKFYVKPEKETRRYESFTLDLDVVKNNAELYISWENTQVHFTILTNSNKRALEEINKTLSKHPDNANDLAYAAYYLDMNQEDPELLFSYIDRALKIKEDWWFYEIKLDLLVKSKRLKEAEQVAQKAIDFIKKSRPEEWEVLAKQFQEKLEKAKK